ncbi:MAG TPA: hypothetical protein VHE59_06700 [Mucilaginibacter sp.]|nr:hypothetical protein [Mucilaginibacter sp.]
MMPTETTLLCTGQALNAAGISRVISEHLQNSDYNPVDQQYILGVCNKLAQAFMELIEAYVYDGRYYIVAQKIYLFKSRLLRQIDNKNADKKIAKGITAVWLPVCEILLRSPGYSNKELRFAIQHLKDQISRLTEANPIHALT